MQNEADVAWALLSSSGGTLGKNTLTDFLYSVVGLFSLWEFKLRERSLTNRWYFLKCQEQSYFTSSFILITWSFIFFRPLWTQTKHSFSMMKALLEIPLPAPPVQLPGFITTYIFFPIAAISHEYLTFLLDLEAQAVRETWPNGVTVALYMHKWVNISCWNSLHSD